jgi:hypothetical protein
MQLNVDVQQPARQTAGSAESPQPWIRGVYLVDDGPSAAPAERPYSFLADCECPADCLRDHDNE